MENINLSRFPFFPYMSDADKKLLHDSIKISRLIRGRIMTGDNNRCLGILMVISGRLRLFRLSEKGREMTLYRIGAGELCLLSGVCALGSIEYHFSIEAERSSTLAIIPPETFKELLYRSEPFMSYVFGELAKKLILSIETIEMLLFSSIEERILVFLQNKANAQGEVRTTHEKMAVELGTSREVITRQLQKISERGLVRLERGLIIVDKSLFFGNKVTD